MFEHQHESFYCVNSLATALDPNLRLYVTEENVKGIRRNLSALVKGIIFWVIN